MEFILNDRKAQRRERKIAWAKEHMNKWEKKYAIFPKRIIQNLVKDRKITKIKSVVWLENYYRKVIDYNTITGSVWTYEYKSENGMKEELAKNLAKKD